MKPLILFIDDEPNELASLRRLLHRNASQWTCEFIADSVAAWERIQAGPVDVVVSDVMMPGIDGIELLRRIRSTIATSDLPVVMMTGLNDASLKRQVLVLGATDLLNKPIQFDDLTARLRNVILLKSQQDELKQYSQHLDRLVNERTEQLAASQADIIWRLAKAAEYRDEDTGNHVVRVACYAGVIAAALGLSRQRVETLFLAAPLHDIGKIGVPDGILLKAGGLTPDEWEIIKQHTLIGERILREPHQGTEAMARWGGPVTASLARLSNPLLDTAAEIAVAHHEKWNGSGYPKGLAGEAIPLEARIVAVADVFDATTSQRPYKLAYSVDKALDILAAGSGQHFDPEVYEAFLNAFEEIEAIRHDLGEPAAASAPTRHAEADEKHELSGRQNP